MLRKNRFVRLQNYVNLLHALRLLSDKEREEILKNIDHPKTKSKERGFFLQ